VATAALNQAVLTGRLTEADEELLKTVRAVNVLGFGLELIVPDKLMVLLHGQGLYGSARLHGPADGLLIRTAGATVQGTNYGLKVVEAGGQTFGPALNFAFALGHNALTFGLNVVPFASIAHGSFDEGTMIAGWSRAAARALERPKKED
jgi:hypothetical protein